MTGSRIISFICISLVSCGTTEPALDITGLWDFTETVMSDTISCEATGGLVLSQFNNSPRLAGERTLNAQSCTEAPEGFALLPSATVLNAELQGSAITMELDFCFYEGTVETATVMSGTISCLNGLAQQTTPFSGTWQASR